MTTDKFSALGAQLRDQTQTEVRRLQQKIGAAIMFITHDQKEMIALGDKIIVMNDSYIQQSAIYTRYTTT